MDTNATMETKFKCIGMGIVTKDKPEDSMWVEVHPVENMPSMEGDYNQPDKLKYQGADSQEQHVSFNIDRSKTMTCRWMDLYNSNRGSAPDVVIGEKVLLWQVAGDDTYYWTSIGIEMRKREKVLTLYSNKNESAPNDDNGEKAYYTLVDTRNKEIVVHTADNDGEYTPYDLVMNTEDGVVTFEDGKGNFLMIESQADKYTLNMLKDYLAVVGINYDINCTYFSVNNPTNELIQVMMDWTDVCTQQMHVETIGSLTSVSSQTINEFLRIKARLATFKNGAGYISTTPRPVVRRNYEKTHREKDDSFAYGRTMNIDMRKNGPFPDPADHNTSTQEGSDRHGEIHEQDRYWYSTEKSRNNPGGMNIDLEGKYDITTPKVETKTKAVETKTDTMDTEAKTITNKVDGAITNTAGSISNTFNGRSDSTSKGLSIESNGNELLAVLVELLDVAIDEEHDYTYSNADGSSASGHTRITSETKAKYRAVKAKIQTMMG